MLKLDFGGKKALVCGSTAGIGKATAIELASHGATVTLLARNEDKLKVVRDQLPTPQGQAHDYLVADFSDPDQLRSALDAYVNDDAPVHILVNNTGGPPGGPAHAADPDAYLAAFRQHLICNQILAQALIPGMQEEGFGRILNIISTSVKQPLNNLGVSNTIRGAVANWAKTLANELGQYGITVNNVLPGATETERLASIIGNKAAKTGQSERDVALGMQGIIPAGRFAKAEEIAYAVVFLASDSAAYINGINLPVDGGRTKSL